MRFLCVLAILVLTFSCTSAIDVALDKYWELWKKTYQKRYSNVEEPLRYVALLSFYSYMKAMMTHLIVFSRISWESNLKKVQEHNLLADLGVYTYWLGMNKFADLVKNYN